MCSKSRPESKQTTTEKTDTITTIPEKFIPESSGTNRTIQQMWNDFYAAKDSVDSALVRSDFQTVKHFLKKAAFHAVEVSRKDIAAWQLNNIGYYSIVEFKRKTDYDQRMRTIENMRRGPEKIVYIKETKELFKKHLPLLLEASQYLEDAYELDKDFNNEDRTQKIYSNLTFIDWVRNFTNAQ
ncbi:MAG: hypothetical protein ACP5FZ_09170 [Fidelibacterota bacterium]